MKTKRNLLICALWIICITSFSQNTFTSVNVNGLEFSKSYSKEEVTQKLGTPTQYIMDADQTMGTNVSFKYGTTIFTFNNGILVDACIENSSFKLYNSTYVGMNISDGISMLSSFGITRSGIDDWGERCIFFYNKYPEGITYEGSNYHYVPICIYYDSNNLISRIRFTDEGSQNFDIGSFTMQSGYIQISSNVMKNGGYASFNLVFYPSNNMYSQTQYKIATISENCRPTVTKYFSSCNMRIKWSVRIEPNGDVFATIQPIPCYCDIIMGVALANQSISFGPFNYDL